MLGAAASVLRSKCSAEGWVRPDQSRSLGRALAVPLPLLPRLLRAKYPTGVQPRAGERRHHGFVKWQPRASCRARWLQARAKNFRLRLHAGIVCVLLVAALAERRRRLWCIRAGRGCPGIAVEEGLVLHVVGKCGRGKWCSVRLWCLRCRGAGVRWRGHLRAAGGGRRSVRVRVGVEVCGSVSWVRRRSRGCGCGRGRVVRWEGSWRKLRQHRCEGSNNLFGGVACDLLERVESVYVRERVKRVSAHATFGGAPVERSRKRKGKRKAARLGMRPTRIAAQQLKRGSARRCLIASRSHAHT